ncbi:MAG: hypothetical protein US42_C0016G0011 [Candidatus Magasanikbacteria bacterium GW2011_GWC2_37_14]|uniref:Uncharacterized protein n=1 Tax=Candidatus Magasanikbacteria bacterium GW2011_GWC2_37_14 TaxID=1619046 RepID=A0A0G0JFU1_9BACT|nr:MAG: hypothetical protein US42_C0016G0011 [Candidatus Magasanikbacteria bacterium GW2011_GWC2_37_14]
MSKNRKSGQGGRKGNGVGAPAPAISVTRSVAIPAPTAQVARQSDGGDTFMFSNIDPHEQPLFQLNLNQDRLGWPTLRFTWCLNTKTVEILHQREIRFPYMFVAVFERHVGDHGEVTFQDVARGAWPLERGIGSIEFHRAGKFVLVANIVGKSEWDSRQKAQEHMARGLKKDHGQYSMTMSFETSYQRSDNSLPYTFTTEVEVEPEFFAKKPKGWMWRWVNLWFGQPPDNECIFRRRMMVAFSIQIPVMLVYWIISLFCMLVLRQIIGVVLVLVLFLIGRRDLHLKPLWHPWEMDLVQCQDGSEHPDWDGMGTPSCYFSMQGKKSRHFTTVLLLTPGISFRIASSAWGRSSATSWSYSWCCVLQAPSSTPSAVASALRNVAGRQRWPRKERKRKNVTKNVWLMKLRGGGRRTNVPSSMKHRYVRSPAVWVVRKVRT